MKVNEQTGLSDRDVSRLKKLSPTEMIGEIIKLNRTDKYSNRLDVLRVCSILQKSAK